MKKYEGLFILETAGKEEGIKDVIDKISSEITAAGGKVETVQKMEKRNFARASAARKASTSDIATTTLTMIRLFFTSAQKCGRCTALPKFESVGWYGNQTGVLAKISLPGLNAVETIQ